MLLKVIDAEFKYGEVEIFRDVNLEINEKDRIGLIGRNGAGKSTFLKILYGSLQLSFGNISKKNGLSIGYLRQNADFTSQNTVYDELLSVFSEELELLQRIDDIATQMSKVHNDVNLYEELSRKYNNLMNIAHAKDAYGVEVRTRTVLNGMGLQSFSNNIVDTLSGGEKTKVALCKLLLMKPELLILDEPTNHLDYKTLDWLETYLTEIKSALLLVSHDRYFLDKLCNRIWELDNCVITRFIGNYSVYKVLKSKQITEQEKLYEKQQKEIAKLNDYIARNKVRASTANMAKSREKRLNKIEIIDKPVTYEVAPRFEFVCGDKPSEKVLDVNDFSLAFGERTLLSHSSMSVIRGEKVALIGLNGVGKSSLLKRIVQSEPLDFLRIVWGKNVEWGYYDQENLNLNKNLRVLDQLWFDNTQMSQTQVRNLLASVNIRGEDVFKTVANLSGGEMAKLGLAMLMSKEHNFLILDEPTNHLDLQSREALENALKEYSGTILFVSHDRYFINAVADKIVEIENCNLCEYKGNYDDFVEQKKLLQSNIVTEIAASPKKNSGNFRSDKQRVEETNRRGRIKQLELHLTELESEENRLNAMMVLPEITADYKKMQGVLAELQTIKEDYENTMKEWEEQMDGN
ncbi:MAG: ABC-F family ATP-binding cassette domain-containing protein [Corallococcus sp.]|nr:ABC-F family ATP-binding cassette domain-containing protein [Corallococcus sp.]